MFWTDLGKGVSIREDNSKGQGEREVKLMFQDQQGRTCSLNLDELQAQAFWIWLSEWIEKE